MKGRHTPAGSPGARPEADGAHRPDGTGGTGGHPDGTVRGATVRRIALWAGLLLCVVFTALAVWSFVQFDRAIENPQEGGFSGWMCDAGRDCGS